MFTVEETTVENPSNENFYLHTHNNYEIYLFLEGDTRYIVEGNSYDLKPYDIIVIRKNELHRAYHNSSARYRRIVINVTPEFFSENDCGEYEEQFFKVGTGNKIDAETVLSGGIYDAFRRLKKYTDGFEKLDTPIAVSIIIELLYLIKNTGSFSEAESSLKSLGEVIGYINHHYTENITLDSLEKMFFVSKYHLCHTFRKATGLTVHHYITKKRLMLVRELVKNGKGISEAAMTAGFCSYSSFYRAYIGEFGESPQKDIRL